MSQNLVDAVRSYATANYNKDGWDILVECWSDQDIIELIGNAKTERSAISNVRKVTKTLASHRSDIQNA